MAHEYAHHEPFSTRLTSGTSRSSLPIIVKEDASVLERVAQKIPAGTISYKQIEEEVQSGVPGVCIETNEVSTPNSDNRLDLFALAPSDTDLSSIYSSDFAESRGLDIADIRVDMHEATYSRAIANQEEINSKILS
jgi:hypothetical protein